MLYTTCCKNDTNCDLNVKKMSRVNNVYARCEDAHVACSAQVNMLEIDFGAGEKRGTGWEHVVKLVVRAL